MSPGPSQDTPDKNSRNLTGVLTPGFADTTARQDSSSRATFSHRRRSENGADRHPDSQLNDVQQSCDQGGGGEVAVRRNSLSCNSEDEERSNQISSSQQCETHRSQVTQDELPHEVNAYETSNVMFSPEPTLAQAGFKSPSLIDLRSPVRSRNLRERPATDG